MQELATEFPDMWTRTLCAQTSNHLEKFAFAFAQKKVVTVDHTAKPHSCYETFTVKITCSNWANFRMLIKFLSYGYELLYITVSDCRSVYC